MTSRKDIGNGPPAGEILLIQTGHHTNHLMVTTPIVSSCGKSPDGNLMTLVVAIQCHSSANLGTDYLSSLNMYP